MKKRLCVLLLLLAVMIMAWLPAMGEEEDVREINIGKFINVTRGETTAVEWPDFRQYFDWMSLSNFDITYTVSEGAKFTLNPDGSITVAEDAPLTYKGITFTFTPKVEGKGQKTIFNGISVYIHEKVTEIVCTPSEVVIYMDEEREVEFYTGKNTLKFSAITNISCNTSIIKTQNLTSYKDCTKKLNIVPQRYGTTDLVATAYNGVTGTMKVSVVRHPSYVRFGGTYFSCNEGETIDIGTDFGNGSVSIQQPMSMWVNDQQYPEHIFQSYVNSFFDGDLAHFKPKAGFYDVTLTTVNGHSGSFHAEVYSDAVCTDLNVQSRGWIDGQNVKFTLLEREELTVFLYDAKGKKITLPLALTKGAEHATLEGNILKMHTPGLIELTATNPDGTTYSETFEILPNPTEMTLNSYELVMEVGDTFTFEIGFDKGTLPHNYKLVQDNDWPEYGLATLRQDGLTITAQSPGTATFSAWTYIAGDYIDNYLTAECKITVLDNEKTRYIDRPEYVGIHDTCQITVREKSGKVIPATFAVKEGKAGYMTESGIFTTTGYGDIVFTATLEDGSVMRDSLNVVKEPAWLRHSAIILRLGKSDGLDLTSDVGKIGYGAVDVTVANPRIVSYSGGVFTAKMLGETEVTVKSRFSDAEVTFEIEVIRADSTTYVGMGELYLPYGFTMDLDAVYNAVELDWWISHEYAGMGNPAKNGFEISNDELTCIWPSASCEVTGMSKNGGTKVKLTIYGYRLPEAIRIEPEISTIRVAESLPVSVLFDDPGAEIRNVYWVADTEGIIGLTEVTNGTENNFWGKAPGTTLVMAYLDNGAYALCMVTVYDPYAKPDEPDVPSDRLPGDADQDGSVTIMDALAVLQYSVGWDVDISMSNADVDADGSATIMDALRILQYCVGWDAELL